MLKVTIIKIAYLHFFLEKICIFITGRYQSSSYVEEYLKLLGNYAVVFVEQT